MQPVLSFPNLPPGDCWPGMQFVYVVWNLPPGTVGQGCSLYMQYQNLPPWDCRLGLQPVYAVSLPTSKGLLGRGTVCLCGVYTYLPGTVGQGCSLFMWCLYLPLRDCWPGVQSVYVVSIPTSKGLLGRGAVCLCGVYIYLQGTVGQGCSLFMWCLYLPSRDCWAGVQSVYVVTIPTSKGLLGRGAVCLWGVYIYLQGAVGQGCSLFMGCLYLPPRDCWAGVQSVYVVSISISKGLLGSGAVCLCGVYTYLQGTVGQWCSLFMWCLYLPPRDCWAGVQFVYVVSIPTSKGLLGRGAVCLCCVYTYLSGTVGQGCSLFMWCLYLPPRDCWAGVQSVYEVSISISKGLLGRGAVCLCGVYTYLQGTVGQGCSLFMWCLYLPPRDCWAVV